MLIFSPAMKDSAAGSETVQTIPTRTTFSKNFRIVPGCHFRRYGEKMHAKECVNIDRLRFLDKRAINCYF